MIPDEIRSRRWRLPASITAGEVEVYAVYGSRAAVRAGGHDLVVDVTSLVPVSSPRTIADLVGEIGEGAMAWLTTAQRAFHEFLAKRQATPAEAPELHRRLGRPQADDGE